MHFAKRERVAPGFSPARWLTGGLLLAALALSGCAGQAPRPEAAAPPPAVVEEAGGSSPGVAQSADDDRAGNAPAVAQPEAPSPTTTKTSSPQPPTPSPTPTSTPTATPIPSPTATPTPALRRLTEAGCCTQPFWSPDGRRVLYIDKPAPDLPTGIWALDVAQPQPTPELFIQRIAYYSADFTLRIELGENTTTIERLADPLSPDEDAASTSWEVPAQGRPISISPGQTRIAWDVSDEDLEIERRVTQVWVANLDGSDAQVVATLPRGGLSGWLSDDVLILSGRESLRAQEQVLFRLSLVDGQQVELVRSRRLRGGLLSPDRAWLAYYIALDEEKPEENGLWLVRTDGSERRQLEPELFGAYQWRDSRRLLIIPFRPEATSHQVTELDVETGQTRALTDPAVTPFKVANGDWRVSPDGRSVIFVGNEDRAIWLLTLPE